MIFQVSSEAVRNDSHRPVLLMLALALLTPAVRGQVDPKSLDEYRGFRVDYSEVRSEPTYETLRAAVNKQIQMVVAVGLPDNTLAFFRSVPLNVVRGNPGFGGQYVKRDKKIALAASFLERGHKPALLHEFLHAYHNQVLPDGYQNKTVLMYYERAKATNAYDAKSHMMANVKEYFASAATAYLFGVTQLEPFTREKVEKNQPAFHKYLQSLFGPGAGKYRGTIAPPSPPVKGVSHRELQ